MTNNKIILIILILSITINIILLCLLIYMYNIGSNDYCDSYSIYNNILFSNIQNVAKSGDLLLFANSRYNVITRVFGHPSYSHVGLIIKKDNELYSLELVTSDYIYPKKQKFEGAICIPLKERIANYSGNIFYCKLNKELTNSQKELLIKKSNEKQKYSIRKACGYYIAKILEDLKIASNLDTWKIWNIHDNIVKLCNGKIYDYPIKLISDDRIIIDINKNNLLNYC